MLSHFPASSLEEDTQILHPPVPRAPIRCSYFSAFLVIKVLLLVI